MSIFSERIKKLRIKNKTTQKQISAAINISERNYQDYEYGKVTPTGTVLIAIADYFDVSLDYLVGRTDNPNSHKTNS